MKKFTFHTLGVPFTATSRRYLGDAMTQNVFNMCRLLTRLGHTVYHYSNFGAEVECTECIEILNKAEMETLYGQGTDVQCAANGFYVKNIKSISDEFVRRATSLIAKRKKPGDFLLGVRHPHGEVGRQLEDLLYVQHSVGHLEPGPPATIFASEYIRNITLGVQLAHTQKFHIDPRSTVIPHFLFSEEFDVSYDPGDYLLFMGRLSPEKGLDTAIKISSRLGKRLLIAGQGDISVYGNLPAKCEYLGYIGDFVKRNELLRNAEALLMTSQYEAFGLSAVEALMSGTPVLTPDFSSFPEINSHGTTGYRCSTIGEYLVAARQLDRISRPACRKSAESKFSSGVVAPQLQHYFEKLQAFRDSLQDTHWFSTSDLDKITHN